MTDLDSDERPRFALCNGTTGVITSAEKFGFGGTRSVEKIRSYWCLKRRNSLPTIPGTHKPKALRHARDVARRVRVYTKTVPPTSVIWID